jgi:hypothetical protein
MSYDNGVLRGILIGLVLAAAGFAAQSVDGHVVNSVTGIDIPGVTVNLVRAGLVAYSATTDLQGRFRIEAVQPGIYAAHYSARGFWPIPNFLVDENFESQCGPCFLTERGGRPFSVTDAGGPVRLEVKMPPLAKITGRVLDDAGHPVPNAGLQFYWGENWLCRMPSCFGISREAKTNEKGEYSVTGLDVPGAWLVSATAPASAKPTEAPGGPRLDWAQTFYPGVTDPELSARVLVRLGAEVSNLDIRLAAVPVHRIRGVVLDIGGNPQPEAAVTLRQRAGSRSLIRHTASDGTFEFEAAPEGEWRISAKVDSGGHPPWSAQWIQLKAHDLENLVLRPAAPFAIQGKIVLEVPEGTPAPQPPRITLAFNPGAAVPADKPAGAFLTANPDAKGDFRLQDVYPGLYQILPGPAPLGYYLDSIRIGGQDALGAAVEVAPGVQALTVTYKPGGGTVRGKVENCAAGTVRLLPRDKTMRREGFVWFAACDANDRYEIAAVRPGEYYVIAIAGNTPVPWYATTWDDDGLLNTARAVTVRAEENSSADLRAVQQ